MTAHVRSLTCEEVLAHLSGYLDGELDPSALAAVEAHLHACDGCTRFGEEFRATVVALRDHLRSGPGLPAHLRSRLEALLEDDEPEG